MPQSVSLHNLVLCCATLLVKRIFQIWTCEITICDCCFLLYHLALPEVWLHNLGTILMPLRILSTNLESSSLHLSLLGSCLQPLSIMIVLCRMFFHLSTCLSNWEAQDWTQYPRAASPVLSRALNFPKSSGNLSPNGAQCLVYLTCNESLI